MLQKDSTGVIMINGDIQPVNATFEMDDEHISLVSNFYHNLLKVISILVTDVGDQMCW